MNINFDVTEIMAPDYGGGSVYYHNNKSFTGIIVEYYSNGNLSFEKTVVNGSTEGRVASYYEKGQIEDEYFEKNNRLYGIYKEWDENGSLLCEVDCGP